MNYRFTNGGEVDTLAKAEHVMVAAGPFDETVGEVYVAGILDSGAALRASGDLLYFGIYDTPVTGPGFHAYASKLQEGVTDPRASLVDLFGIFTKRVASVHFGYTGNLIEPANKDIAVLGWVQVDIENGWPTQTNFLDLRSKEERDQGLPPFDVLRGKKHNYIDALLKGYALKIRVLYTGKAAGWRDNYAAALINTWAMDDRDAALKLRNERIQARTEHVNVHRPIERENWRKEQDRTNGIPVAKPPANKETGELQLMVAVHGFKKKQVNMFTIDPGTYSIANAGRILNSRPYDWDPDVQNDVDTWLSIASKGLSIVLES